MRVNVAFTFASTFVGAIKNRKMFGLQLWSTFNSHCSAYIIISCFNFFIGKSKCFQQIPLKAEILLRRESQALQALFPKGVNIEYESDLKGSTNCSIKFLDFIANESFFT